MKSKFLLLYFIGSIGLFSACQQNATNKTMVTVSIAPIQYFVDRLTDSALVVNVMVPQGASHGTYSPTASQMQKLSESKVYFRIGSLGYEQAFIGRLKELNPTMREVDLTDFTELIRGEQIDHGDHVHEGGIDPHIWMSPAVMIQLLPVIADNLMDLYPELKETIETNQTLLLDEMKALHHKMEEISNGASQKRFLIFHPALTYMARDYGLEQVSIEHDGKEPSPARLSMLIKDARADSIPFIFIQEEYDVRNAELVAQETGAKVVRLNHLAYDWVANMEDLMLVFKENLK
jgi:zinc transport system substrate-binding protein